MPEGPPEEISGYPGMLLLQVMYAIGGALILMIPLRRIRASWMVLIAVAVLVGGEYFIRPEFQITGGPSAIVTGFLVSGGLAGEILIAYPILPWWAMMALGWGFAYYLIGARMRENRSVVRMLLCAGIVSIALFAVIRGLNGFGNMQLLRLDGSWIQWIHTSKYPPSFSFVAMELGLMALILAGPFGVQKSRGDRVSDRDSSPERVDSLLDRDRHSTGYSIPCLPGIDRTKPLIGRACCDSFESLDRVYLVACRHAIGAKKGGGHARSDHQFSAQGSE